MKDAARIIRTNRS
jgi:hypothetical protein